MPRRSRLQLPGVPFHVIQRGNNRGACFFADDDYAFFLDQLELLAYRHAVAIHSYVLMTNHIHLLVTPATSGAVSALMKRLGQRYVQSVNRTYARTGSLWEGRFRSTLVDSGSYLLLCQRYIELNPVRAGMIADPGDYRWSSYRANALGVPDSRLTPHSLYQALGTDASARQAAYRELFRSELPPAAVETIRATTNSGFVLGNPRFQDQIAAAVQRRVVPAKRGPKPNKPGSEEVQGDLIAPSS